jgi:hypothetical protein
MFYKRIFKIYSFIDRNIHIVMAALPEVEVIKGIKPIRICITNRILMDINGYYYGGCGHVQHHLVNLLHTYILLR